LILSMTLPSPSAQPAPRRILVVFNPAAGGARRARFGRVVKSLLKHGCNITVMETAAVGHAETIARDISVADFDVIAAAGGDGTINEIVNGLIGKDIALGLIPLGTANVLADEIGLGRGADQIARTLASGPIKAIRVGRANGRRFTMMAGVGFDANVVHGVSLPLKKKVGALAYVWQALKQATFGRFDACDVTIDGAAHHPTSVVICNGRRYGGPFIAAPDASVNDDRFYVILMNGRGWFSVLRYGIGLMLGRLGHLHDVLLVPGREIVVKGVDQQPVQADGDIITTLPLTVTVDTAPLRVVYPK